jgi:hypothetical protein
VTDEPAALVTLDDAGTIDRFEAIVARLEAVVGIAAPAPAAALDANGFPGHVAPDELIESAWGNAVVDAFPSLDQVSTVGNNLTGEAIVGTFAVPNVAVARRYLCLWYWRLAGHTVNGTLTLRSKLPGNTVQALSGDLVYAANWPTMGTWVFELDVPAGNGGFNLGLYATATGTNANTNFAGNLFAVGLARHA